jgi:hypothetical protein
MLLSESSERLADRLCEVGRRRDEEEAPAEDEDESCGEETRLCMARDVLVSRDVVWIVREAAGTEIVSSGFTTIVNVGTVGIAGAEVFSVVKYYIHQENFHYSIHER